MKPLVSILMTAYNREKYIEEAIQSVLASTYTNFELIIVDDCSSDSTVAIARSWACKDARISVYVNESNLGDYGNRNKAASLAKGKYLKYVDSDDMIYSESLDLMVNAMEHYPEAAMGLSARERDIDKDFPVLLTPSQSYYQHFFEDGFLENGPLAVIIRKDIFDKIGGFSGKRMIGDTECWLKLAGQYPVIQLPKNLLFWRQHEGQEYNVGYKYYLVDGLRMYADVLRNNQCPLTTKQRTVAFKTKKSYYLDSLFRHAVKSGKFLESFRLFRQVIAIKL